MFNLKKYVFLLLITIIPLVSSMESNDAEEKLGKKYEKLVPPVIFDGDSFRYRKSNNLSNDIYPTEQFCVSFKKNIELPDYLEDLYKSYEDMEKFKYAILKEKHYEKVDSNNLTYEEKVFQAALNLRFALHNKRIELLHLSKNNKER